MQDNCVSSQVMKLSPQPLRTSLRISVHDIRIGMFIAELDRPWAETPFLIQGFLLNDPSHLRSLRDFVAEVMIDPTRSLPSSLNHLPWDALHMQSEQDGLPKMARNSFRANMSVVPQATFQHDEPQWSFLTELWQQLRGSMYKEPSEQLSGQPSEYYLRYKPEQEKLGTKQPARKLQLTTPHKAALASELTPPSSLKFSQYIAALYPRHPLFPKLSHFFSELGNDSLKKRKRAPKPRAAKERPDFLPASQPLVVYHDQASMAEEVVRARKIFQQADLALEKIVSDIQADLPVRLESVQPIVEVLVDSVVRNPAALMWSTRMRDESKKTYQHGLKVAIYIMTLGRHLGFPKSQLEELGSVGLLLDIGMLKIPSTVLDKSTQLTPEENTLLLQHVEFGMQTLQQKEMLPTLIAQGIMEHHERMDGSGYPKGISGEQISIYGRMAAIADTFAAMTSARNYDITHSAFDAMKELFREAGTRLHAPMVEQFVQAISIFPVGSLIELSTGEAAIVLEHNGVRRLEPKILVLTDPEKNLLQQPAMMDLMNTSVPDVKILRGLADGAYGINYQNYYLN
jgi:HD-GYP domain-containing protein (c-di-GMP phosphodiesterase class II)